MKRLLGVILLLAVVAYGQTSRMARLHPDYVPDEKTAERIAEAVLVGQYGQDRINAQLPLVVRSTSKGLWLVEGTIHNTRATGGNFGVWIDKHDATVKVMEHMK